jgi:hypothetical protein
LTLGCIASVGPAIQTSQPAAEDLKATKPVMHFLTESLTDATMTVKKYLLARSINDQPAICLLQINRCVCSRTATRAT